MGLPELLQMIASLVVIVFLANFLLKKLNKFQQPSSQVIKIIERVQVSKTSSLCIVQVESDYMLMSISDTSNEVIKTFTTEEKDAIQQRLNKKHGTLDTNRAATLTTYIKNMKQQYAEFQKRGTDKT